jgi:predicted ATPase
VAVPPTLAPDASITPTVATDGGQHNLPPGRDRFFGRSDHLAAVVARLAAGERLVTLLGMGGTGKTRLALEVARARAADRSGGAWWVDLAEARDAAAIERAVARALDVPLVRGGPERLTEALVARGPTLLILDNFEQIIQAAPATAGRWLDAAPDLQLLTTSREPLRLRGEQVVPIGPLDPEPAVELFCDRAAAAGATVGPSPDVSRVVALLDFLPLGIELAAARARAVAPARMADRLSGRLDGLRSRSVELPARHRTLTATIRWSWDLLSPWEQAALSQVSVFEGGFSMDAADRVLDLSAWPDAPWPEDALAELVDTSLLRAGVGPRTGQPRFSLLRSVQQFAHDRLSEAGRTDAAQARHGACFAAAGSPSALEALHRHGGARRASALGEDLDNLVAAVQRAAGQGDGAVSSAAALAAAEVLHRTGPLGLALDLLGAALQAGPPPDRLSAVLAQQGALASLAGRTEAAQDALDRALAAARAARDPSAEARALGHLGNHMLRRGRLDDAEAAYGSALSQARAAGDDRARGVALSNLGILRHWQARLDAAERAFSDALDLHRRAGDRRMEAIVLLNLGNLEGDRGRLGASRAHLEAALSGHREVGNRLAEGVALGALGRLDLLQGRVASAESRSTRALSLQRSTGNLRSEGVLLGLLADVHAATGRLVSAVALGQQALRRHEAAASGRWIGLQRGALAGFALDACDLDAAEAHLTAGLAALDAADPAHRPLLLVHLGRLHLLRGDPTAAWQAVAALDAAALPAGDRLMRAEVLTARVEIARQVGRSQAAAATLADLAATLPGLGLTEAAALSQRAAALGLDPARFTAAW